jgi:mannose-6-phosphate isomerase-like protein (cupin superfamily)
MNMRAKQTAAHYVWGDNCDSWIIAVTEVLCLKQESMPAHTKEKLHFRNEATQFFFILKGTAIFFIDGDSIAVPAMSGLKVAAKQKHFIANKTDETLDFLVVSHPAADNDRVTI